MTEQFGGVAGPGADLHFGDPRDVENEVGIPAAVPRALSTR
ncbi:hypothetical protein [Streptosporangium sp. NPDC001681]